MLGDKIKFALESLRSLTFNGEQLITDFRIEECLEELRELKSYIKEEITNIEEESNKPIRNNKETLVHWETAWGQLYYSSSLELTVHNEHNHLQFVAIEDGIYVINCVGLPTTSFCDRQINGEFYISPRYVTMPTHCLVELKKGELLDIWDNGHFKNNTCSIEKIKE